MIVTWFFRDVVVVGAGPAGLATAIAAAKSGLSCQVIEKGALVNSLLHYPTEMVFFTTPELMEIGGMPFVSPYDKPTRLEALRYYRRVSDAYELDVVFDEAVVAITRDTAVPDAEWSARRRYALDSGRAPLRPRPHGRRRHRRIRFPESARRARRGSTARLALLHAAPPVLQEEGRQLSAGRTRLQRRRWISTAPARR